MQQRTVTINDPQGLHAQMAHQLTHIAGGFAASIWIRHAGRRASLADPIQILALAAPAGAEITVMADGLDETDALDRICSEISATP